MEKNGLGIRNPSVRLVWYESKFCGNKRPKCELICAGVGTFDLSAWSPSPMVLRKNILLKPQRYLVLNFATDPICAKNEQVR